MFIKSRESLILENQLLFLITERILNYSPKFMQFIKEYKYKNKLILDVFNGLDLDRDYKFNNIDITFDKNDTILFSAGSKVDSIPDYIGTSGSFNKGYNNSSIKVGRFFKMLLTEISEKKPLDKEIEEIVNLYKGWIDSHFKKIQEVKGELIRTYYYRDSYAKEMGTLGSSCMKYETCQEYLDLYVEEEKISLLVILNEDGKIAARALLWILDDGIKFLDRIYTIDASDETIFKQYAIKNNWLYKDKQSYTNVDNIYKNHTKHDKDLTFTCKKIYSYYPYMDTLKFLDTKQKTLNSSISTIDDAITLTSDSGNAIVYSKYYDIYIKEGDSVHSDVYGHLPYSKAKMLSNKYYPKDELSKDLNGRLCLKSDLEYNVRFGFFYDISEDLMDVYFYGEPIAMPESYIWYKVIDGKRYWRFNLFKYELSYDVKYSLDIPENYKQTYELVNKLTKDWFDGNYKCSNMEYSAKSGMLFGKENSESIDFIDYDFRSVLIDFNYDFQDNFKDYTSRSERQMVSDCLYNILIKRFNKINYPDKEE